MGHLEFSFVFIGLALYCIAMGVLGGQIASTMRMHPDGLVILATAGLALLGCPFVIAFVRGLFHFIRGFFRGVIQGRKEG